MKAQIQLWDLGVLGLLISVILSTQLWVGNTNISILAAALSSVTFWITISASSKIESNISTFFVAIAASTSFALIVEYLTVAHFWPSQAENFRFFYERFGQIISKVLITILVVSVSIGIAIGASAFNWYKARIRSGEK